MAGQSPDRGIDRYAGATSRPDAAATTVDDNDAFGEVEAVDEVEALDSLEGLHIVDPDAPDDDAAGTSAQDLEHLRRFGSLEDHVDVFIEAFNAHDVDYLTGVVADDLEAPGLGEDREGLPWAMQDVWDRRPNAIMTRGLLGDEPVGVVWDVGDSGTWTRIALLVFGTGDGDGIIGLVEVVEDPEDVAAAETGDPESDVVEGATWDEWYEGERD